MVLVAVVLVAVVVETVFVVVGRLAVMLVLVVRVCGG